MKAALRQATRPRKPAKRTSRLVIGWEVNEHFQPKYWLERRPAPKPGRQSTKHLVRPKTEAAAHHTIIVAQSGSGKSFFVGRLIEEIMLRSDSRVLIFDPNSDFRRCAETVRARWWRQAHYDPINDEGHLPHETNRRSFVRRWDRITKKIYCAGSKPRGVVAPLSIDWLNFSIDWFADDADFGFQSELKHCHNFINALRHLVEGQPAEWRRKNKLLAYSQKVCDLAVEDLHKTLRTDFRRSRAPRRHINEALLYKSLFTPAAARCYFGFAREAITSSIFATIHLPQTASHLPAAPRLQVVDLPSIANQQFRMMAVGSFIDSEWREAYRSWNQALMRDSSEDTRVPLFIVLDEAHEIIPAKPTSVAHRRLREWFRIIAAEGRKFGVFLILISQRPDKIDPAVVSECENKAVMKIGSELVLDSACHLLGLTKPERDEAKKCLSFGRGRVLLCGPWAPDGQNILYGAMRRTEEGGRNLRPHHWARERV